MSGPPNTPLQPTAQTLDLEGVGVGWVWTHLFEECEHGGSRPYKLDG